MNKESPASNSIEYLIEASQEDQTLLEFALKTHIPIPTSCGGYGTCGACRVKIERGVELLPSPNEIESEFILERNFLPNERLACQIPAIKGIKITIP